MSTREPGMYDHLNDNPSDSVQVTLTMQELVTKVRTLNYGEQRFLSELLKQRKESKAYREYKEYREHTAYLEEMLLKGYY